MQKDLLNRPEKRLAGLQSQRYGEFYIIFVERAVDKQYVWLQFTPKLPPPSANAVSAAPSSGSGSARSNILNLYRSSSLCYSVPFLEMKLRNNPERPLITRHQAEVEVAEEEHQEAVARILPNHLQFTLAASRTIRLPR